MKYDGGNENTRHISVTPCKTGMEMVQVTNHCARHHQVLTQALPGRVVAKQIKWLPFNDKKACVALMKTCVISSKPHFRVILTEDFIIIIIMSCR